MHHQLFILGTGGTVQKSFESDIDSGIAARLWMRAAGAERTLHAGWLMILVQ